MVFVSWTYALWSAEKLQSIYQALPIMFWPCVPVKL